MTSAHLLAPSLQATTQPMSSAKTPWDPTLYLDSASCRQVAHVIEGSHLRLGLLLEVQLLTFNLDISSTWGQTKTVLTLELSLWGRLQAPEEASELGQ